MANGKRGGARPNSGPKKGAIYKPTLSKAEGREILRAYVMQHMPAMTQAQVLHAQGIKHMILRGKDGQFIRATDEKQIDAALAIGESAYYLFTKDPSVQAYTDLMNRALDKPSEHVEVTGADKGPLKVQWEK